MADTLVDLFLQAIHVEALSLHEAPMAKFVRETMASTRVRIVEDAAARRFKGDCNNLICIPGSWTQGKPAIALFAHLDTPRPTGGVKPVVTGERITSDGSTALGVDNRAGVSILLHALLEQDRRPFQGNFLVVFTVAEEIGMYGAREIDLRPYGVTMAYVFDCSRRPGTFIRSAVGSSLFKAAVTGRASHAGVAPEKGINAIQLAARAIAGLPTGRLDGNSTGNIALISGGSATNIVPDTCTVEGEARGFTADAIDRYLDLVERTFRRHVEEGGGSLRVERALDFPPFELSMDMPVVKRAIETLKCLGLSPEGIEYLGGSDANMLNAAGLPAVNLGIGAQNPHGNDEFILLEDLAMAARIARALIDA